MNKELVIARIKNQFRIHWRWLKDKEDYKEVVKFIECCINQMEGKMSDIEDRMRELANIIDEQDIEIKQLKEEIHQLKQQLVIHESHAH